MFDETKVQPQETDAAYKALNGSAKLALGGLVVAIGDFIRYAGQDGLHFISPERFSGAHELFDAVGQYGLEAVAAGSIGFLGAALAGRVTDRFHGIQQ